MYKKNTFFPDYIFENKYSNFYHFDFYTSWHTNTVELFTLIDDLTNITSKSKSISKETMWCNDLFKLIDIGCDFFSVVYKISELKEFLVDFKRTKCAEFIYGISEEIILYPYFEKWILYGHRNLEIMILAVDDETNNDFKKIYQKKYIHSPIVKDVEVYLEQFIRGYLMRRRPDDAENFIRKFRMNYM